MVALRAFFAHEFDDSDLVLFVRIANLDMHHEPIELRLGQRVGALVINRVLRGHHHEQPWQRMGGASDRDLPLFHGFEQCGLDFRGGAIDFVGQHDVAEDGARLIAKFAAAIASVVDLGSGDVRRQQVGCELNAGKVGLEVASECLHGPRLGQAG